MAYSSSSSEANLGESSRNPVSSRSSQGQQGISGANSRRSRDGTSRETRERRPPSGGPGGLNFDVLAWYPKHQSCAKFFLDHAQHEAHVQAFAAFLNILLPYQRQANPIFNSSGSSTPVIRDPGHINPAASPSPGPTHRVTVTVSLIPYMRRLVVTGMDVPQVLHGFFGNDWQEGMGPQREVERRNYLFAAKSEDWASVKKHYDMLPNELVPFLRPLQNPTDQELVSADKTWSDWLAMQDWMVGSRAPAPDHGDNMGPPDY